MEYARLLIFDKLKWTSAKTTVNSRFSGLTQADSSARVALSNERHSTRPNVVTSFVCAAGFAVLAIHALECIADIVLAKLVTLVWAIDTSIAVDTLVVEAIVSSSVSRRQSLATASPSLERVVGAIDTAVVDGVSPAVRLTLVQSTDLLSLLLALAEFKEVSCSKLLMGHGCRTIGVDNTTVRTVGEVFSTWPDLGSSRAGEGSNCKSLEAHIEVVDECFVVTKQMMFKCELMKLKSILEKIFGPLYTFFGLRVELLGCWTIPANSNILHLLDRNSLEKRLGVIMASAEMM